MMKKKTNDKWHGKCASLIATTIMDTVHANGAVQPRLFAESDI